MPQMVTGVFHSRRAVEAATDSLLDAGVSRGDISVLMSDETRGREFGVTTKSKAPEGATAGAVAGGVLGAIIAGLAAVGTIVLPGLGLVAAGPLLAALAGAGAGGTAGGLIGGLVGLGIPEHEAKMIHEELRHGGILLGVHVPAEQARMVKDILRQCGGEKVRAA